MTIFSGDTIPVEINITDHTVKTSRVLVNRTYTSFFDLSGHSISNLLCKYFAEHTPSFLSSTLIGYCHAFQLLLNFLHVTSCHTLNAESYAAFIEWMKTHKSPRTSEPLTEGTRRAFSTFTLKFMEWLLENGVIKAIDVTTARSRHRKAWRGSSARQLEQMRLKAISPEDYARLIRAIRLEYEESKELLEQPRHTQDEYEITFPLLPFTLLLGAELAIRSAEFNYLNVRDLRGDRLLLNPPNKKASEVWLPPSLMSSLDLAQNWMANYRTSLAPDDSLLALPLKKGPRRDQLVRFDTMLLPNSMSKFYKKYFSLIAPDGMPYLYRPAGNDQSDLLPFTLPFSELRSAAITEAARHERNPTVVMRFARHQCFRTTMKYYIRETHRQWVTNVAMFLAPSAERVRISLENKIARQDEEEKSRESGASVPGGHCASTLSGDQSCVRASDCRLCAFFRIHVSKREFFVREMKEALEQAHSLQSEQGLIRDVQNLREFAALNQAIIDRIDEHLAG